MPAFVDTGLNLVHVDDVARGHLAALALGKPGERYILGGEDMTLQRILQRVAEHVGRPAPTVRLPHWLVYPVASRREGVARITGREPRVTLDGVRMSTKHMYFSSRKAERELGYRLSRSRCRRSAKRSIGSRAMATSSRSARARARANFALIKYWGKAPGALNVPAVGSISITLDALWSDTEVEFGERTAGRRFRARR